MDPMLVATFGGGALVGWLAANTPGENSNDTRRAIADAGTRATTRLGGTVANVGQRAALVSGAAIVKGGAVASRMAGNAVGAVAGEVSTLSSRVRRGRFAPKDAPAATDDPMPPVDAIPVGATGTERHG